MYHTHVGMRLLEKLKLNQRGDMLSKSELNLIDHTTDEDTETVKLY